MHLKSYAVDGRLLRTGSANWSPTGLKRQDNDVRYEFSPTAVEHFEEKFNEMWDRAGNTNAAALALLSTTTHKAAHTVASSEPGQTRGVS